MDIQTIRDEIISLENGITNFANCEKLASLYIVYEHLISSNNVEKELNDILPEYQSYTDTKREYQLNNVSQKQLIQAMWRLCVEIKEFIVTLNNNTELPQERLEIQNMLNSIKEAI